jgi:chloride channel 3/4/5
LKHILTACSYNGFPVVVSEESQYLVGYVARKDLASAILNADRNIIDTNPEDAQVFFTDGIPDVEKQSRGPTLRLRRILDLAPITITDQTPMETVKDMFTKLGLRQLLVTHNGRLLGIVTKKDVLNHFHNINGSNSE